MCFVCWRLRVRPSVFVGLPPLLSPWVCADFRVRVFLAVFPSVMSRWSGPSFIEPGVSHPHGRRFAASRYLSLLLPVV